ncbi:GNAT family N-acetyltransferase [Streptomyces sp. URMC 129]|uniref:GNAT family N-acetyltransferase n=1 Tax=Streptomyces sp. URMC 129 TaxID=3423407 RepID=UPI003F1AD0BD
MGAGQEEAGRPGGRAVITVRDALHEDIPGICATMPLAFGLLGGAAWQDPAYIAGGLESCAAGLSAKQKIKVALAGMEVVGSSYSGLALAPDGQTAHREIGVVHGVAVRPENRRHGAASALLAACEKYLIEEGARVMIAEARPGAVPFFSARGYEAVAGMALIAPTPTGTYVLPRSTLSTALMWKKCFFADTVKPQASDRGTVLAGLGGGAAV